jgi:hypothetical protein
LVGLYAQRREGYWGDLFIVGGTFGHAGEDCTDLVVLKVLGFYYADDVAEIEAARIGGGFEDAVYVL